MAKKKQYGYTINIMSICEHSYRSPEKWGKWSESYTNSIVDNIAHRDDKYPNVTTIHNFKKGQNVLVVWIEYSSGDSFGHSKRGSTEVMGLFKDMKSALSLKEQIESWKPNDNAKKWEDKHKYHFKTPDGQEFKCGFAPWSGYFEYLDSVNIDTVVVY